MRIAGLDLAWRANDNTSAAAIGNLNECTLKIEHINAALSSIKEVMSFLNNTKELQGIAVDAPLIIMNHSGQRSCESKLSMEYGARKASCHSSNLKLYPAAGSIAISNALCRDGYEHLQDPMQGKWLIECYPHPAILEIFGLPERLRYKKGKAVEKKAGQIKLSRLIKSLEDSCVLKLLIEGPARECISESSINLKRGVALKQNEDALDAIICVYIGALYALKCDHMIFGDIDDGYIYVPRSRCV